MVITASETVDKSRDHFKSGRFLFFNLIQNVFGLHPAALVFEAAAMLELLALSFFTDTLKSKK